MDWLMKGYPFNYSLIVGSGAGGDVTLTPVVPQGQIWFVKYLTAYHADDSAPRVIVWNLIDAVTGVVIQYEFTPAAIAANIRYPFPMLNTKGPLILTPTNTNVNAIVQGVAAAHDAVLQMHGVKMFGVSYA